MWWQGPKQQAVSYINRDATDMLSRIYGHWLGLQAEQPTEHSGI